VTTAELEAILAEVRAAGGKVIEMMNRLERAGLIYSHAPVAEKAP